MIPTQTRGGGREKEGTRKEEILHNLFQFTVFPGPPAAVLGLIRGFSLLSVLEDEGAQGWDEGEKDGHCLRWLHLPQQLMGVKRWRYGC